MIIGGRNFDTANHTYIMGILNVTPDSFSDGGKFNGMDAAIAHARQMVEEGVDIIDVGGESTRPGHIQITDEEEIARVTPIIEVLKKEFDVPVSIDTYKSYVAEAALQAGADLVNDIWGLKYDEKMASVIAKYQAACCLMHNREKAEYQDFLKDFMDDMKECVRLAKAAGIEDDKIILDPGVGFGKTYEMNLEIIDKMEILNELGYPVLVRPSYVLGGQGMQIAINDDDIREFMSIINRHVQEHPILVDKYLMGKEVEVDAVCDGENILIPGIMEHVERAGIHSGDSISVYPAMSIKPEVQEVLVDYTAKLAKSLHVIGLINIQFIVYNDEVFVIEVNPRSSRTVPYISKVTGIPIVKLASRVILGEKITDMGYTPGLAKKSDYIAIKMPVFSFEKLRGAEISLGPEMKSTGECLGIAKTFNEALHKAFMGAGINLPKYKKMILTVNDNSKDEAISVAKRFQALGYEIYATRGTAKFLGENGVSVIGVNKIEQESPTLMDLLLGHEIDLVIDIPKQGEHSHDGFLIRRTSIETGVTCLTSLDTANALLTALEDSEKNELTLVDIATIDTK